MTKTEPTGIEKTSLRWDVGTAYELFISLIVLHQPEIYGLRASWAAGIRSRIPAVERKFLEETLPFLSIPLTWLYRLSAPKDALSVLWALRQIPPAERMKTIFEIEKWDEPAIKRLPKISERHAWDEDDFNAIFPVLCKEEKAGRNPESVKKFLDWWARPEQFGETYLAALQAYQQVFFADEEKRIAPILQAGLEHAQEMAPDLSFPDLLAELSQGVHMDPIPEGEVILVPAYWITPLLINAEIQNEGKTTFIFLFGVRPANMAIIPGELVPDGLLRTLKALADPTRLKIMYYLSQDKLTPSELARRLNLRPPTVTHHLSELRLAGLVNLTIKGQEKHYTARREALPAAFNNLETFLDVTGDSLSRSLDTGSKKLEDKL
jgi:DNA-binding transcriptional ArsR family regulator